MARERSAGIIPFRKDKGKIKYLLLHYKHKSKYWDFPRGNIEEDEDAKETALRELKEETGIIDAEVLPDFEEQVKWYYKRDEETIFKTVTYFLAESNQKEVKLSEEHIGFSWASYKKALERLTYDNSKRILKKAHGHLAKK